MIPANNDLYSIVGGYSTLDGANLCMNRAEGAVEFYLNKSLIHKGSNPVFATFSILPSLQLNSILQTLPLPPPHPRILTHSLIRIRGIFISSLVKVLFSVFLLKNHPAKTDKRMYTPQQATRSKRTHHL